MRIGLASGMIVWAGAFQCRNTARSAASIIGLFGVKDEVSFKSPRYGGDKNAFHNLPSKAIITEVGRWQAGDEAAFR